MKYGTCRDTVENEIVNFQALSDKLIANDQAYMGSGTRTLRPSAIAGLTVFATAVVFITLLVLVGSSTGGRAAGTASDGPGVAASWTTGNKIAVGTSADTTSKVWFTVAKGITTEVFYPRLDVPNMQDMQYIVTDGSTFVDLERDATNHEVSMPDEKALEYTITNTDSATPKIQDHQHLYHRPEPRHRA